MNSFSFYALGKIFIHPQRPKWKVILPFKQNYNATRNPLHAKQTITAPLTLLVGRDLKFPYTRYN